jgi:hypothetical protein
MEIIPKYNISDINGLKVIFFDTISVINFKKYLHFHIAIVFQDGLLTML